MFDYLPRAVWLQVANDGVTVADVVIRFPINRIQVFGEGVRVLALRTTTCAHCATTRLAVALSSAMLEAVSGVSLNASLAFLFHAPSTLSITWLA